MSSANPNRAVVRRTLINGLKPPAALTTMTATCTAGAQCTEVGSAPLAKQALGNLTKSVTTATDSEAARKAALVAYKTACKTAQQDFMGARKALGTYETVVNELAAGNAKLITAAGLLSRDEDPPAIPLDKVSKVLAKPWREPKQAKVSWPEAAGATSYALELNFTPQDPSGPWTSGGTGSRRTRIVTTSAPGGQFLARVAAVAGDGTHSAWSTPILVTAR